MPAVAIGAHRSTWWWSSLGLAGSIAIAVAGPRLAGGPVTWWYHPTIANGSDVALFYAGVALLSAAWLALRQFALSTRRIWIVTTLWCLPLLAAPPLFSQDAYSYLAQGTLVHLGIDPYRHAPAVLGHLDRAQVLNAVAPFWRHTTAPYGPLFLKIVSWLVAVSGSNLVLGVLLVRLVDLAGLMLLALCVPRVARALGAEPARAGWWVLSPLVLLALVAPAHNDLLMVGLLVAGVALALEDRLLLGIGVCALAATIKLPAAAAIPFIAVAWAQSQPNRSAAIRSLGASAAVAAGVLVAVSLATGLGFRWISTSLFSTPGKVQLAITPATSLGWSVAQLVPVSARGLESALGVAAFVFSLLLGARLLWRVRPASMVRYLGIALIAAALGGPAAWPWYESWGLVLLAACPKIQDSRALAVTAAASVLVVKADGILAFPLHTAPLFLLLYLVAAAIAYRRRTGARPPASAGQRWRARVLAES
jgi:alpha-1,6-mannosyltransferase